MAARLREFIGRARRGPPRRDLRRGSALAGDGSSSINHGTQHRSEAAVILTAAGAFAGRPRHRPASPSSRPTGSASEPAGQPTMSRDDGPGRRRRSSEILVAIGTDDLAGLSDRRRFTAHLALGAGLDPTWLDLFSEAVRTVTGSRRARRTSSTPGASSIRSIRRPGQRRGAGRADDRAGRPALGRGDRPARRQPDRPGRRALDRPARRGAGRAAARGEALDPAARRRHRRLLPVGPPARPTSCSPGPSER